MRSSSSGLQARRLVGAGREHHHRSLVEDHLQFEAEFANRFEQRFLVRHVGADDDPPDGKRNALAAQQLAKGARRRIGEHTVS
jgi:hypothetical protein